MPKDVILGWDEYSTIKADLDSKSSAIYAQKEALRQVKDRLYKAAKSTDLAECKKNIKEILDNLVVST